MSVPWTLADWRRAHHAVDDLLAAYLLAHAGALPAETSVLALTEWSNREYQRLAERLIAVKQR